MEEKILNTRKNGMAMLLLTLLGYVASIALFIYSVTLLNADRMLLGVPLLILSIAYWIAGIFLFCGLKVLKPQEALVLTLFGDYIGTLKGQGFYWVNPFCTAVNPAAGTKLSQSGDVTSKESGAAALLSVSGQNSQLASSSVSKKISLKMMTLNNSRQKINDCLGNPVEIGIAVIWRVTDTAKAVFNVDNYKEYLSLQRYYVVDGVRYHHLIDPDTLWPARYFDSVSVLSPDSGAADCLTTGLFCMSLEDGQKLIESLDGVEALWCTPDGEVIQSSGWADHEKK